MIIPKTHNDLLQLIADGVEESVSLDYKAADALQNTDGKKKEIAKDVSAMANSAGGVIIYGIGEFNEQRKKHLPERITPIDRTQFSKEQLEQIINNNISPKIENLIIHPITLDKVNEVVYVVEIPQSTTAHQNSRDFRYYKRNNFESTPMQDYELKDIMGRSKHPEVEMKLYIERFTYEIKKTYNYTHLQHNSIIQSPPKEYTKELHIVFFPFNNGNIYAKYVNFYLHLPMNIIHYTVNNLKKISSDVVEIYGENTYRDVVDIEFPPLGNPRHKYGPSRFDPILAGLPANETNSNTLLLFHQQAAPKRRLFT